MGQFTGIHYIKVANDLVVEVLKEDVSNLISEIYENEYVIIKNENGKVLAKYKYKNGRFIELPFVTIGKGKNAFTPLNPEQECAFDMMADNDVKIKVLTGLAGSGKTKIAIKFGLTKLDKGEINKIFLVRNPVHVGEQLGFHKGDKLAKTANWNNPIKDNMDDRLETLEELVAKGKVELDIPSEMKGRDLKNSWIIVDEAEDLTEELFKMIGERVAEGSTIVFTGDIGQATHLKYKNNSGLKRVYKLRGKTPLYGSVELIEDVRSEVSKVFATIY